MLILIRPTSTVRIPWPTSARHNPGLPAGTRTGDRVAVAGRVLTLRDHGGLCFATLRDWTGDLQIVLENDPEFARRIDLGDHVGAAGAVGTSRRG